MSSEISKLKCQSNCVTADSERLKLTAIHMDAVEVYIILSANPEGSKCHKE
jgi:hypothetical protein